jgi:hypothetical protein
LTDSLGKTGIIMRWTRLVAVALFVLGLTLSRTSPAQAPPEPDTTADDQKTLRDLGLGVDGPALLDYFRKRTFKEADPQKVKEYIRDLGDEEFQVREKAHTALMALGSGALVGLREAESKGDAETKRRAAELRQAIEAKAEPAVQAASARLIARLKPAGAAPVLLGYLPFADGTVIDELCKALGAVAVREGKADPALVEALGDKVALKRAAAGQALAGAADHLPTVRKLLKDTDPVVRVRVALTLVHKREKEALPVLVEVLEHLAPDQLYAAEELLVRLAGEKAPSVSLGTNEAARKTCREAWAKWLTDNQDKIDLAKVNFSQTLLGYTLVVQQRVMGRAFGEIMELDRQRKTKWSFEVTTYPVDAEMVGPERVLVAEFHGGRVSERDLKGNVVWQVQVNGNPIGVQRLPNGNTFVVLQQNRLVEYDKKGAEVYSFQGPQMFRARKLRNGEIIFVTATGQLTRMEAKTQKQLKTFQVGNLGSLFGSIDILPNGHVVVPLYPNNRVVEFDRDGKEVGVALQVNNPNSAKRLPNGHTLVGSLNHQTITEFDRSGRVVWTHRTGGTVFSTRQR